MRATLILSALVAVAAAAPFAIRDTDAWAPLPGTSVKCSEDNKYMSLVIGPENADSILKHSCAAFMPTCAYPTENKIDPSTACADVVTYPIDGPNNITLPVLVEQDGNKLSGWAVNFFVIPKENSGDVPVQWTKDDCEGYINVLVEKDHPNGCNSGGNPGVGNLTIGSPEAGRSRLTGTIVGTKFVKTGYGSVGHAY